MEEDKGKRMIREPLLSSPKGGIRTVPFIIANEAFERVASFGLMPNMVLYLTRQYGLEAAAAANILFLWQAATNFMPTIGAFLADSCAGRFTMIGLGCTFSLLGMILLWLTTVFPRGSLPRPGCLPSGYSSCKSPATSIQLAILYTSFALMSIGAGGIRSSSLAFGADQFDRRPKSRDPHDGDVGHSFERFIGWYYASITVAAIVAVTCVAYIQDNAGWMVGFGVPVMLMFLSTLCFFLASPFYVKVKVDSSLITRFAQVVVAAYSNRNIGVSSQEGSGRFYCSKGSDMREPSPNLRFLNKACFTPQEPSYQLLMEETQAPDPWRLCTVDQVEELKSFINILPIWSTGIVMFISCSQNSLLVLQAASMDRHLGPSFEIPAASFTVFTVLAILLLVALYQAVILRLASWVVGRPVTLTPKTRMGIGLLLSVVAVSTLAVTESARRQQVSAGSPPMSAVWLIPYYVIIGIGEGFNAIAQNEFYLSRLPKSMSSVASCLTGLGASLASAFSSFIITAVDYGTSRGEKESWVSTNIDSGHYDFYYWVIAGLSLANFGYFLASCRAYQPCEVEGEISKEDSSDDILY